ncbi:MAG TPA: GWxTD domain-containing protein [Thermoanaerobaculia bacterium]|nr:GWxTD domain-containing protein [Thermoanaerobaculia bacterium]
MKFRKPMMLSLIALFAATGAFAALSPEMKAWGEGPVQHLMTAEESAKWKVIRTDAEAQAFADLFWARRDPTPATPINEAQIRFDELVKIADSRFTWQRTKGSMSDRGKVMILVGLPTSIQKSRADNVTGSQAAPPQGFTGEFVRPDVNAMETWTYEKDRIPPFAPTPGREIEITFVDRHNNGDFRLDPGSKGSPIPLMNAAVSASIVSPNLTEVPQYAVATPSVPSSVESATVPAPQLTPATAFKTEAYKVAIDEFKKAQTSSYKNAYVTYGEGVTADGEYFVPVQLYLPKESGVSGDNLTFFASVENAQGEVVGVYEEAATLSTSKDDAYYDKSLNLAPGKYTAVFGLASNGKPVSMAKSELDLAALDPDAAGTSRLILSNNVFALTAAQQPTDPFAFGGIKVVPKGDRTFQKADELWYFLELRNPGMNPEGQPKVQVKLDVEGTTAANKKVKMSAPLTEAAVEPLKGVEGHFALGSSIPLEGFEPGDYMLKVRVIDTVSKQTYNMQQEFKVGGAG